MREESLQVSWQSCSAGLAHDTESAEAEGLLEAG